MARWIVTIEVDADDDATAGKIAAVADDAIADACHQENEDPVAGFDATWGNAQVVPA